MADPFEFRKDGHLLGVLSGVSQLGAFIAYEKMQVTATGRARGYFDLKRGEIVHTPQSMLRQGTRVQLPLRDGMLCRILVGSRKTGKGKKASTQMDMLCLSYVQPQSHYEPHVVDPLGLYTCPKYGCICTHSQGDGSSTFCPSNRVSEPIFMKARHSMGSMRECLSCGRTTSSLSSPR